MLRDSNEKEIDVQSSMPIRGNKDTSTGYNKVKAISTYDEIIGVGIHLGASDITIYDSGTAYVCIQGETQKLRVTFPKSAMNAFQEEYGLRMTGGNSKDFAITCASRRLRANMFRHLGGIGIVLRVLPVDVPSFDSLGLPSQVTELASIKTGLIVVAGVTGSGKTSTLAAIINAINKTRRCHIITIEDPIEIIYDPIKSAITQREVGTHVESFAKATVDALRQNPDVIVIGEVRDTQTVVEALRLAETGHLVLISLHTSSAVGVIGRIIDMFPDGEQAQVKAQLLAVLQAVSYQTLLKGYNNTRVPLIEVLRMIQPVRAQLRNKDINEQAIRDLLRTNKDKGCLHRADHARMLLDANKLGVDSLKMVLSETDFSLAIRR